MRCKILWGILPLVVASLGVANAGDVHAFKSGETVDPSEIARMLGGGGHTNNVERPTRSIHHMRGLQMDDQSNNGDTNSYSDAPPKKHVHAVEMDSASAQESEPEQHASSGGAFSLPINFGYNSAQILPESLSQLDAVGQGIKQAGVRVVIEGHTDAKGSVASNRRLSLRRAEAVKQYLRRKYGISGSKLLVEGKGSSELLNSSDPYAEENRRVQFRAAR